MSRKIEVPDDQPDLIDVDDPEQKKLRRLALAYETLKRARMALGVDEIIARDQVAEEMKLLKLTKWHRHELTVTLTSKEKCKVVRADEDD